MKRKKETPVILLYTTSACHLCEQAEALLQQQQTLPELRIDKVEISESDELVSRYGIRIPVIRFAGSEAELGWPFDAIALAVFLQKGTQAEAAGH